MHHPQKHINQYSVLLWLKERHAIKGQFKKDLKYFTDRSKAVLLLWIVFVGLCFMFVCFVCLFLVALSSPAGKGLPLGCRVCCALSLSQMFSGPHQN